MDELKISVHKNYADYAKFIKSAKTVFGDLMEESQNVLFNHKGEVTKPFSLKYLAEEDKRKIIVDKFMFYLWLLIG